jgi:hypothetical protein
LCEREEKRIAANSKYRTPPRTLKRLAEAHMFYDLSRKSIGNGAPGNRTLGKGTTSSRAVNATKSSPALAAEGSGPWDSFSTRTLGLRINQRMAKEFDGESQKIRQASTATITKALKINPSRWTVLQNQSLENWSLVLTQIPNLSRWTPEEKHQLIKIIRAKCASTEMPYLHQTQNHARLKTELLRLGS